MRGGKDTVVPEDREHAVRLMQSVVCDADSVGHHWMALSILLVQLDSLKPEDKALFDDEELDHIRQLAAAVRFIEPGMRYIRRRARRLDDGELDKVGDFDPSRFDAERYKS
jgi:hypothetical protein